MSGYLDRPKRSLPEALAELRCKPADLWNGIDRDRQARSLLDEQGLKEYRLWCMVKARCIAA